MIYVADLGRWLNIRPDSEFVDLLWKVNDAREHAILRAEFVLSPEIVRRTVTPGMMSYTYYFVSPRTAAGVFARDLDESSPAWVSSMIVVTRSSSTTHSTATSGTITSSSRFLMLLCLPLLLSRAAVRSLHSR